MKQYVPTQINYGQVNFRLAFWEKKPGLHTDCCTIDHFERNSKEIPEVNLPYAELRLHYLIVREVKEFVCKRLDEFGRFFKAEVQLRAVVLLGIIVLTQISRSRLKSVNCRLKLFIRI